MMRVKTMKSKFIFDKVRKSTAKDNQIAVQGFCNQDFLKDTEVCALLCDDSQEYMLKVEIQVSNMSVLKHIEINDKNICRMLTILIDVPKECHRASKLVVVAKTKEKEHKLFRCNGGRIKKLLSRINYSIDSVYSKNDEVVINGWVLDSKPVKIEIYEKGNSISDIRIERKSRTDVINDYVEYKTDRNVGFVIYAPQLKDAKIKISAGDNACDGKLKIKKGSSKIGILSKFSKYFDKLVVCLKERGIRATLRKVKRRLFYKILEKPQKYEKWFNTHKVTIEDIQRQKNTLFEYEPVFSIIVPLYETKEKYLRELIESVKAQTYSKWQLCFSDGSKNKERLEKIIKGYSQDQRIKYIANTEGSLGISENTNQALSIVNGDYVVLGDHDDLFAPNALFECAKALNDERYDVIYTDEDKVDGKGRKHKNPHFKPDFNIDLLRGNNYICHMFVVSKALIDEVGGFDKKYDGAQDYDFILRCIEGQRKIYHIPKILYHWRVHESSTACSPEAKMYAFDAGKRALEAHYKRLNIDADVESTEEYGFYKTAYKINGDPKVSIIIPNKDHVDDLKKCINSIDSLSVYKNYEFVIVENNSEEDKTFEYYKQIEKRDNVKVIYWDNEFNYSAINNYGVDCAEGEYILLLNNDTEIINGDCIAEMLGYCQRDDVGVVGARLYYEDGSIQHAGVIVGIGGIAGHAFVGLYEEKGLYMSRTKIACDYSAVTAACMMVKKSVFEQVGGLDEGFKVAFNDIDFCMKVRALGKLVVYNPNAKLYHYESKSRGYEDTPEKQERFLSEIERFTNKWPEILENGDPYYNCNLALDKNDFSVAG